MPANDKRVVEVVKRSGFDKSFRNTLTSKCGTLTPVLFDEWMPNTIARLAINVAASMPPLVSDTYMNVRLRFEAFAIPHRLTQANFEDFYNDYGVQIYSGGSLRDKVGCMPLIKVHDASVTFDNFISPYRGKSTLLDYLGCRCSPDDSDYAIVSAILECYHLVWQEWYRNPRVQKPAFVKSDSSIFCDGNSSIIARDLPYRSYVFYNNIQPTIKVYNSGGAPTDAAYYLADGVHIFALRQRNFPLDYFTSAMVTPLQGDMPYVTVPSADMPSGVTGFTIAALRAMNSLAQFRERNNLTSPRYQQQIYARTGTAPSDGVIQRPILIGAATYDVYSHGVTQSASNTAMSSGLSGEQNYFSDYLGCRAGNGFASGSDLLVDNFHAKEPMYFLVLASLVPEVSYSQCLNPVVLRYKGVGSISDMADPILQNVGPEPIIVGQLYGQISTLAGFNSVFAYADRYSTWMFKQNEVHGEFNDVLSGTLNNYVLQRNFASAPSFGSSFLEIPVDYLDRVVAFTVSTIGLSYWMDIAFDYKVSMPLQQYCIPSLQNPAYEHGKKIVLRKNGQLL